MLTIKKLKSIILFRSICALIIVGNLGIFSGQILAETFNIVVKVTLVKKACDIYGIGGKNDPITVDFEDMIIKQIDGQQYEKVINYTISCEDSADNPALKLQFNGDGAPFDSTLLRTEDNDLGLKFRINHTKTLALSQWEYFNYANKPILSAIPVKKINGNVRGGTLKASGTLTVEYD